MSLVEEAVRNWEAYRAGVIAEIENTPEEKLDTGDALISQTMPSRMLGTQNRLSVLWFAAAHEMYHRGQLTAYERGVGTVPALTQAIHAMLAK